MRALFLIPIAGLGLDLDGWAFVGVVFDAVRADVEANFFVEGERRVLAGPDDLAGVLLRRPDVRVGDWSRAFPFVCDLGTWVVEREADRIEDTSLDDCKLVCLCDVLLSRVGVGCARNSGGIGLVRPDFRRPSMMNAVGV